MPAGRPSKYRPEFCEKFIELCKKGLSRRAFCAEMGIATDTFYRWVKENKEFSDAYKVGEAAAAAFYEKAMLSGALGQIKGFNVMAMTFLMKNRYPEDFRDRQDVEISGKANAEPIHIKHSEAQNLTEAELKELLKQALREDKISS